MTADDRNSKERILKVAGELFNKYGIRSISMDDIAHHLGISKKTIYQYFSDKDEIVTLTISQYLGHEKDRVKLIQAEASDAVDFLIKVNQYLRSNIRETTTSIVFELHKYHHKAWTLLEEFKKEFLYTVIRKNVESGIRDGHFRDDINPEITSRVRLEEASMPFNEELFPKNRFNIIEVSDNILDHFVLAITTDKGRKLYQRYKTQLQKSISSI